ncbi:MAG: nitrogen fixation protein NifX [Methylococcales bacterium]|nr:nitrogen fixation protein NifX [Methylococcales bacterium]
MSQNALSRELALRIGLAARALPDTTIQRLMTVLTAELGLPLTEDKLATLNLKTLKAAGDGEFSEIEEPLLKKAVHVLKHPASEDRSDSSVPVIAPYNEGDLPNSIRIACASDDVQKVDGHFGSCTQFMIYQVSANEARLIDVRDTAQFSEFEEDKNRFRSELIRDCQVLYLVSVGGPAAAKIIKLGIHPIKLPEVTHITEVLAELQRVLAAKPPPWLAKVMGINPEARFVAHEEEEVVE